MLTTISPFSITFYTILAHFLPLLTSFDHAQPLWMSGVGTKSPEADGIGHRPMILKAQNVEQSSFISIHLTLTMSMLMHCTCTIQQCCLSMEYRTVFNSVNRQCQCIASALFSTAVCHITAVIWFCMLDSKY